MIFKIVRTLTLGVVALAMPLLVPTHANDVASSTSPRPLLAGVGARGVFDPSVTEDPETRRLWMSYSSFDASLHSQSGVNLRLASSDDGETWRDAGIVQRFTDVVVGPLAETAEVEGYVEEGSRGTWQNGTSTLVYDGHAPRDQRWKLFWQQTLWVSDVPRYASYSWIALKMADAPENLANATPIKLFTGYMARTTGESADAPAFSPIPGPPAIQLDKKDAQLGACMFGQPAALSAPDGLYLALDCAWLGTRALLHTVLLRCTYPGCVPTDAATWRAIGRLTEPRDGPQLNEQYLGFGGTSLVENGGRYYLIATPISSDANRYDGCNVYRFEDLAYGRLERKRGKLVVAETVHGIPGTYHGACAAHSRLPGILLSQIISTAAPRVMQIRATDVKLPRK
ncbi:hypothetical protein HNQ60_005194 [Povalibacter uvarum]|uniref:Uncharacterized protein n=1 Tax=Povalibacter uvarum TaxID=732238 RepID=A0A841HWE4_9GAMM|nr:hypothetical protein [Povalibacter uvarum]MBB6096272.1 hypothetical protein [Povalibacter uvarum]